MKPDFFWNAWEKPYKSIYQFLLFIFVFSVLGYAFTYYSGSSYVIHWNIENIINPVKNLFSSYRHGVFTFPINVDNYVISQRFEASDLQVNTWPAYLILIWIGIFISIMLAMVTDLTRFWFVASVVLLTVLFVGLKLDFLVLFNSYSKLGLLVAFALYFPSLYIFHFIKPNVGFTVRVFVHLCATALFGFIIYQFSYVDLPFLHLVNYGIYVPLLLTVLFAFMVGAEILSGLLRVITSGALIGDKSGLVHFLVISLVFMLNAALVLLRNAKIIQIDLYLIGSFWLLTIASIVGIWGYRAKEVTYKGMFSFSPFGAILFICLAITAHLSISYFFITGNDSFVEAIEDVIIFSQLGYSVLFVVYVIANFFDLMRQNIDVGKVLYKPRRMPYFISRFAGVVFIMALFFRFNMIPYYQSVAGFYSGIGDLYLKADDYLSATEYYKLSNIYSGTSHRANYALASLEKRINNTSQEINFLKQAIGKNPTEFAYANLASNYLDERRYFEAVFTLQDGLERFPDNGKLMNNLGLVYMEMENIDSSFYYFQQSGQLEKSRDESATNLFALLRLRDLSIKADTLPILWQKADYLASANNLVVLANQLGKKLEERMSVRFGDPVHEKLEQLVYNYNKSLNNPWLVDSVYQQNLRSFYDSSNTSWFQDNLNFSSALALFQQGEIASSFQILNHLAIQNPEKEYYPLLGKLSTVLNAHTLAIDHFKNAFQNGRQEVAPELAFAYMENGDLDKAQFIWSQIIQIDDSMNRIVAKKMMDVIETKNMTAILNSDTETRFSFLTYRFREFDLGKLEGLVVSLDNEDLQALGFVKLIYAYLELGQSNKAMKLLEEVGQLNISQLDVLEAINLAQCQYAYKVKDTEMMQRLYSNMKSEDIMVNGYLDLFKNLADSDTKDKQLLAESFKKQAIKNPFFEPGVLEAVHFFDNEMDDSDQGYEILLQAVKINPFSIDLNKAYAMQCLDQGLKSYALETMDELKAMMPSVMFTTFEREFMEKMAKTDSESANW